MEEAYKRLWAAVLDQAIKEALLRNGGTLREKARSWLQNDNQDIGSFLWICDVLKFDPQSIRGFLHPPLK